MHLENCQGQGKPTLHIYTYINTLHNSYSPNTYTKFTNCLSYLRYKPKTPKTHIRFNEVILADSVAGGTKWFVCNWKTGNHYL